MFGDANLHTCVSEEMEGMHLYYRRYGLKFLLMEVDAETTLNTWSVDSDMNKLTLRERHDTELRGRMRRGQCMKVSLPLTKCISSGDSCSYRSLERGVFPCRLEL